MTHIAFKLITASKFCENSNILNRLVDSRLKISSLLPRLRLGNKLEFFLNACLLSYIGGSGGSIRTAQPFQRIYAHDVIEVTLSDRR